MLPPQTQPALELQLELFPKTVHPLISVGIVMHAALCLCTIVALSLQSKARFSDTGTSLLITFNNNTDYGAVTNLGGSFACPLLLVYPGASDLDACAWTSGEVHRAKVCVFWRPGHTVRN